MREKQDVAPDQWNGRGVGKGSLGRHISDMFREMKDPNQLLLITPSTLLLFLGKLISPLLLIHEDFVLGDIEEQLLWV